LKTSTGSDTCAEFIQSQNRDEARRILAAKVNQQKAEAAHAKNAETRHEFLSNRGRGDKVRTYNFIDSRVTDHRLDKSTSNVKSVMKGELDLIIS
jgi:peptide chain release factor 1